MRIRRENFAVKVAMGVVLASVGLAACGASVPPPRQREAAAAAAVSAARKAGAQETQRGVLQLQLAEEQLENARALKREGDNRAARRIFIRAQMAAELALALAHENKTRIEADEATAKARNVQTVAIGGGPTDVPNQPAPPAKDLGPQGQPDVPIVERTAVELTEVQRPEGPRTGVTASARQPLMGDKSVRAEDEKKAREALDKIAVILAGSVRLEDRGTIITMADATLFASEGAILLPTARQNLDLVADALKAAHGHRIVVEGYTDSQGANTSNRELSQRRAQAVRAYMVSRGVPADSIRAEGLGGIRPLADNGTIAGRAKNHRIEIVVQPLVEN
jgi:outer membrane protein OmpA-like peptidoglycan-associated protein